MRKDEIVPRPELTLYMTFSSRPFSWTEYLAWQGTGNAAGMPFLVRLACWLTCSVWMLFPKYTPPAPVFGASVVCIIDTSLGILSDILGVSGMSDAMARLLRAVGALGRNPIARKARRRRDESVIPVRELCLSLAL